MSHLAQFAAYAAAFEKAYESDDWSDLEAYFTEDAVYEIGLPLLGAERREGRAAILAWFPEVLNRFDRRFESRELTLLEGPREQGDEVWIRGAATYRAPGVPDFVLELEETARFEGDRIAHLEDRFTPEMRAETESYALAYAERLGIELRPV
jgi:ketosteroid isomerase-like protein